MSQDVHVEAGEPLDEAVARGGVVRLGAGVHAGPLTLDASVTLLAEPGAVLDAGGAGAALRIDGDGLAVRVEGLTVRGGHADAGGGLALTGHSDVTLVGCVVRDCRTGQGGGGGAFVERGRLLLEGCTFEGNRARVGADLMASGIGEVEVRGGRFAGDVAAREDARLSMSGAEVGGKVDVRGTTTRAPSVQLRGCAVAGGVRNDAALPGRVEVGT